MKGIITASACGLYKVMAEGQEYSVSARGLFKHHKRKIVVGDYVDIDTKENLITDVYDQNNFFIRPLIANVDQAAVVMSAMEPDFSLFLVDKFLTYINHNNVASLVIITKLDKVSDRGYIEIFKKIIESYGIKVILFSKVTNEGLDEVENALKDKVTVLMGQSGVGKSSLLNAIVPQYHRLVGEYSEALGRGKHQTKEVVLLPYQNGYIADTPGFSSLDIELTPTEVNSNFPLIKDYFGQCFFSDCLHEHEKNCKVKVDIGIKIPKSTYENYLLLLKEAKERKVKY